MPKYSSTRAPKTSKMNMEVSIDFGEAEKYFNDFKTPLGETPIAQTYRGNTLEQKKTLVTMKFFKPRKDQAKHLRAVRREVSVVKHIAGGPNIIGLRDVLRMQNVDGLMTTVIVTDYMDAIDLENGAIRRELTSQHKQLILFKSLNAIAHLHRKGVIHCDIKLRKFCYNPANGRVRLVDFSSARMHVKGAATNQFLGTTQWKSPEVLLKYSHYDFAIDMWGFGMMTTILLNGCHPWGQSAEDTKQLEFIVDVLGSDDYNAFLSKYKIKAGKGKTFSGKPKDSFRVHGSPDVDKYGVSLYENLCVYDFNERMSAEQALKHKYFKKFNSNADSSEDSDSDSNSNSSGSGSGSGSNTSTSKTSGSNSGSDTSGSNSSGDSSGSGTGSSS